MYGSSRFSRWRASNQTDGHRKSTATGAFSRQMFSFFKQLNHFFLERSSIKITPAATTITATHKSGLLESPVAGLPFTDVLLEAPDAAADPEAGAVLAAGLAVGFGVILGAGPAVGFGAALGVGALLGAGAAFTVSVVNASPSSNFTRTEWVPTLNVSR